MKRRLCDEDGATVRTVDVDWQEQDRQPNWQDVVEVNGEKPDDEDEDGNEFILESRRRQHRLVTPEASESGDKEAPGAPKKKKRRILPWTEEGQVRWPLSSTYPTCRGVDSDETVVEVEDSEAEDSVEES